jgi:coenzyme F420-0:L-glutamate ligase/coenzyme F420-1:gamma-L-glutamate ligase
MITVIGLERIGLVKPGDNIAKLLTDATSREGLKWMDGDVVVVSQKIISKAEGLVVDISEIKPSSKARSIADRTKKDPRLVEVILKDSARILHADKQALVVARKDGFVCINAGVDKSNVNGRYVYTRLPLDADRCANDLRVELERITGKRLAVVIGDTYSRPFRVGQVEFAIGISGVNPIVDYRGQKDLFGYELRYKYVALADEMAAAAELVMGEGMEGVPAAIVRGLTRGERNEGLNLSKRLLLGKRLDLFRRVL